MDSRTEMMTPSEMRKRLVGKASEDDEFRARLLADPKNAIREELGVQVPAEFTIEVHEEAANTGHLILPPVSKLAPADLAAVQGASNIFNPEEGTFDFPQW